MIGTNLNLFDPPIDLSLPPSEIALEHEINQVCKRVATSATYDEARPHSERLRSLIAQRSAQRVAQMEKARGLSR
jgi:copper homeostasis protein CutC